MTEQFICRSGFSTRKFSKNQGNQALWNSQNKVHGKMVHYRLTQASGAEMTRLVVKKILFPSRQLSDRCHESSWKSSVQSADSRVSSKPTNHKIWSISTRSLCLKGAPGSYSKRCCRGRSAVGVAEKLFEPFIV